MFKITNTYEDRYFKDDALGIANDTIFEIETEYGLFCVSIISNSVKNSNDNKYICHSAFWVGSCDIEEIKCLITKINKYMDFFKYLKTEFSENEHEDFIKWQLKNTYIEESKKAIEKYVGKCIEEMREYEEGPTEKDIDEMCAEYHSYL